MVNNSAERYIGTVEANLLCGKAQKKRILEGVRADIYGYFEGRDDEITIEMIVDRFGSPEELASSFTKNIDGAELKSKLNKKKIAIIATVIGVIIAVAAIIIGVRCYKRWEFFSHPDGYISETPVYVFETDEEAEAYWNAITSDENGRTY